MHQMSFGDRAPAGPAGVRWGATALPRPPSCIETPRAFGARSSAPMAPRLTPSAFGDKSLLFFPHLPKRLIQRVCYSLSSFIIHLAVTVHPHQLRQGQNTKHS